MGVNQTEVKMRKSKFLSALLLTMSVSSVWGSNDVGETGASDHLNTLSSECITSSNEPFLNHPIPAVRDFGALVENVVYKDESRLEVIKVKIKGVLQKTEIETLWKNLQYILAHPTDVGVKFKAMPGLLQIEGIDLEKLQPITEDSRPYDRTFVMNIYSLIKILELANVNSLRITVQSDDDLRRLITTLRDSGSLKELSIFNINNAVILRSLSSIFHRNHGLTKLELVAYPLKQQESIPADHRAGTTNLTHYQAHQVEFELEDFKHLKDLRELRFDNLAFYSVGIINILKQLPSLKIFNYNCPNLDDRLVKSIHSFADDWNIERNINSRSPTRIDGYDTQTQQDVVQKYLPPTTSALLLGQHKLKDDQDVK